MLGLQCRASIEMTASFQTTFSIAFSSVKVFKFRLDLYLFCPQVPINKKSALVHTRWFMMYLHILYTCKFVFLFTRRSESKCIKNRMPWKHISFHLTIHAVYYLICNTMPHQHVRTQSSFRPELNVFNIDVKCNFVHKWAILARVSLWMAPLYVSMGCYIPNTIPVLFVLINIRKMTM